MYFLDLDRNKIRMYATLNDKGYYVYPLGEPLSVTTRKAKHSNKVLSSNLCDEKKEDKFMLVYSPSNVLYFSEKLITEDSDSKHVSIRLDSDTKRVYIGAKGEFHDSGGIISFSHKVSLNNLAMDENNILCSKKSSSTISKKIKVLAVAQNNKKLFGVYSIPNTVGIALGIDTESKLGVSPKTFKVMEYSSYDKYSIEDWFKNSKIAEI